MIPGPPGRVRLTGLTIPAVLIPDILTSELPSYYSGRDR